MDTLIIKKTKDIKITKNIGRIFRNHNIVEYISDSTELPLDVVAEIASQIQGLPAEA